MSNNHRLASSLNTLKQVNFDLFQRDFLLTWEKEYEDIWSILKVAEILKDIYETNRGMRIFQSGLGISWFRDNSTRTRMSFSSACALLGLSHQEMEEKKLQLYHGETVRETVNMISFLTQTIGIRDDMYMGKGNKFMRDVASALDEGFKEGVISQRPAIINLQCDLDHPTQTMADLLHIKNYFGNLEKLRGKKIVMSWAYSSSYGKPMSVPQGIITLMSRFGMDVVLCCPKDYKPHDDILDKAQKFSLISGGTFHITDNMKKAFKDADVVYPKSWAPYRIMTERTRLLDSGNQEGLVELEKECLEQNACYKDWVCNGNLMSRTKDGKALYMHCLPADIQDVNCKEGEVTKEVFEQYRIETYKEAGYKPFIIAAMILLCTQKDSIAVIEEKLKEF
ncbi:MAG: knotted carbamoyltransferase YgeW [Candidatus Eremiobacterota bacterium]